MLLKEGYKVALFLWSDVDHILRASHIAQQWLQFSSRLILALEI
jgi:hypothetical protein